jgi:hypothetical protein
MLLLYDDANNYNDYSPEEMQKEIKLHEKWIEDLEDHYAGGEPLENSAKSVTGKDKVVTDGPYIESKELIGGYYLINANSLEEAAELTKGCPVLKMGGAVEVREIMKM